MENLLIRNILNLGNEKQGLWKTDACFLLLGQGPVEQSSTNKPLAMRVVEDALAYSKKPPVI